MGSDIRDPEAVLASVNESILSLREIVFGFGEAQTMIRGLEGDILYWSRGAERLYGWSSDEAVGALSHTLLATEFPGELASIHQHLRRDGFWRGELVHHHRSGAKVHVVSHWVLQNSDRPRVVEIHTDISARHHAETTLRHHAALVADSDDAIIGKTLDGIITSWNLAAERMFGWPARDIIGRSITTIIPADKLADEEEIITRLRRGERIAHFETIRRHRDGTPVYVSLTVSPIRDHHGTIMGASKIARDIGPRRQAELMLQRSRRMTALGELTGGVAHDFNNLLSVIVNNVELLRRMVAPSPDIDLMTKDILTAAFNGGALTRRLLTFARQQTLKLDVIDLNTYLSAYVDLLRRTLGEAIQIESHLAEGLWLVRADASQIGDTLINLALNARDAMPMTGGRIVIETGNHERAMPETPDIIDQFVAIVVSDNGAGMAPEVVERAMEPFFTTKPMGQGNGLGLSMVHGTLSQHGGFIEISSTPGIGTTVSLFLPRILGQLEVSATTVEQSAPTAIGGETVLVVDDNNQLRATVIRSLTSLGYRTVEAVDGAGCLALLEAGTSCDLLFTDVVMPGGLTGPQLVKIARRLRPELRVLLTTGFSSVIQGGQTDETFDVLQKPYRFQQLAEAVHAALRRSV
jgi:PAS domain S-box-containing protein